MASKIRRADSEVIILRSNVITQPYYYLTRTTAILTEHLQLSRAYMSLINAHSFRKEKEMIAVSRKIHNKGFLYNTA